MALSFVVSFELSLFIYLLLFQSPFISKREHAFTFLLWLILILLIYLLLSRFLFPRLGAYTPKARRNWILLSVGVGILFALVTRPPDLILFYPIHTLQIKVAAVDTDRKITLEYAKTSLRDIGFGEFSQEGDWQRTDYGLTYTGMEAASLTWTGRTGESASLVLSDNSTGADVQAGWDGQLTRFKPSGAYNGQLLVSFDLRTGPTGGVVARMVVGFTAGFLFLVLTLSSPVWR